MKNIIVYCEYCGVQLSESFAGLSCLNDDCPMHKALLKDWNHAKGYPSDGYHQANVKKKYNRETGKIP